MHEGDGFSTKPFEKSRFHLLTDLSGRQVLTNGKRRSCCVDLVNAAVFVSLRNAISVESATQPQSRLVLRREESCVTTLKTAV